MCHVCLFDYYEISEWAPEYGPRLTPEWAQIGKISGTRNFEKKIGFLQFMIAGFHYDWTIMDKK